MEPFDNIPPPPPPAPSAGSFQPPPPQPPLVSEATSGHSPAGAPPLLKNPLVLYGGGSGLVVSLILAVLIVTKSEPAKKETPKKSAIKELKASCEEGDKEACATVSRLTSASAMGALKPGTPMASGGAEKAATVKKELPAKESWVTYAPKKGFYRVHFPITPKEQTQVIEKMGIRTKMYMAVVEADSVAYITAYTNYYDTKNGRVHIAPKKMLTTMRDGLRKKPKYTLTGEKFTTFNGMMALTMDVNIQGNVGKVIITYKNGHSYQLMTINDKEGVKTKRFFDSFTLKKAIKEARIKVKWHRFRSRKYRYSLKLPCKGKRMKKGKIKAKGVKVYETFSCEDKSAGVVTGGVVGRLKKRARRAKDSQILASAIEAVKREVGAKERRAFNVRRGRYRGRCAHLEMEKQFKKSLVCTFVRKKEIRTFTMIYESDGNYKRHLKTFLKYIKL